MINKKALSTVIATVLLILLVTATTGIVWVFVNNIVTDKTTGTKECFDLESSEKVTLNEYYTCFNATGDYVQFSINLADAEIDSLIVSILVGGNSKSFTLTNEDNIAVDSLSPYKGVDSDPVKLPVKNAGSTYTAGGFSAAEKIDWIKISPVIDKKQCGLSDAVYEVVDCALLTG